MNPPREPRTTFYVRHGKRGFDFAVSATALVALSPLWILIALAIALESRGGVFYRQERIGRRSVPFQLWKFRSMVVGAEHKGAGIRVEPEDPRVTRVGRVIRALSLDEIPQLLNVLTGDMSLVGPRPGLRYQVELYDDLQRDRLLVRPGVTGWAQINGRNAIEWPRRIELDLEYVGRVTFRLDLLILTRTIPSVLRGGDRIARRDYWKEKARERESASAPDASESKPASMTSASSPDSRVPHARS